MHPVINNIAKTIFFRQFSYSMRLLLVFTKIPVLTDIQSQITKAEK